MVLFLSILAFSCNSPGASKEDTCNENNIDDFSEIIGINKLTKEVDLKKILGKSSSGEYSEDNNTFIYTFNKISNGPVRVYVDAETGIIKTVFIEVLGVGEKLKEDINELKVAYSFSNCKISLFGKSKNEIVKLMGEPILDIINEQLKETNVRLFMYKTENGNITLSLNFYPSQNNLMTSLTLDWH